MNFTIQFLYDMNNLGLYRPEMMHIIIALIIAVVSLVVLRYVFLYHVGWHIVWKEARAIAAKKHVLGDLILMKDIQSEMEKDLEKASLKATFQG